MSYYGASAESIRLHEERTRAVKTLKEVMMRLKEAEDALQHCISATGGYTGGAPQKYFDKYGIKYETY